MRRMLLGTMAAAALSLAAIESAQAGHRGSCRTCSTQTARSHGGWYHFPSGGGMYVPVARETPPPAPVVQAGWQTSHGQPVYGQPVRYSRSCSRCR